MVLSLLKKFQINYKKSSFKPTSNLKKKLNNTFLLKNRFQLHLKQNPIYCIRIKVVANNVFCSFWSLRSGKTILIQSAGLNKIKPAKKRLFFYIKTILYSFFKSIQLWKKQHAKKGMHLYCSLHVPKKLRNLILKMITGKALAINFEYSKPFNGCKAKKKRRKKRLGFRRFR